MSAYHSQSKMFSFYFSSQVSLSFYLCSMQKEQTSGTPNLMMKSLLNIFTVWSSAFFNYINGIVLQSTNLSQIMSINIFGPVNNVSQLNIWLNEGFDSCFYLFLKWPDFVLLSGLSTGVWRDKKKLYVQNWNIIFTDTISFNKCFTTCLHHCHNSITLLTVKLLNGYYSSCIFLCFCCDVFHQLQISKYTHSESDNLV